MGEGWTVHNGSRRKDRWSPFPPEHGEPLGQCIGSKADFVFRKGGLER